MEEAHGPRAPEPRLAATIVVARPATAGIELLLLRRAAGARFAPGFLVFPGGTVDPGDTVLAERLFGTPEEEARACGLRELFEETGLLPAAGGVVVRAAPRPRIETIRFDPPSPTTMPEIARWLAPEFLAVRFDARFFAIGASGGVEPSPDGVEIEAAWWAAPQEALSRSAEGEIPLMWPTLVMLEELARCRSVDDVLTLHVEQAEPPIRRDVVGGQPIPFRPPSGR